MLTAYFRPGTYDLLRKNCNSFTSASERLGFTVELFLVFPSKVICFSEGVASHATSPKWLPPTAETIDS